MQRVEVLVVDAPVDDVDRALALRRAHPHPVAAADEVAALDQLDAHQPGEQRVLEVGGVVDARGQHDDLGSLTPAGAAARSAASSRAG